MPTWITEMETSVESLETVCGSTAELSAWATSVFEQRQEIVKLVCQPCQTDNQDSGSEGGWLLVQSVCLLQETCYTGGEAMPRELEGPGKGRHDAH